MNATHDEEWRPIRGYEGLYQVSTAGRVQSLDRTIRSRGGGLRRYQGRILKTILDTHGYPHVALSRDGRQTWFKVHRLVLDAFRGTQPPGTEGCHNDGNPTNNQLSNLRWDSHSANVRDTIRHGNHNHAGKPRCKRGHLLAGDNVRDYGNTRPSHLRRCRTCASAREYASAHGVTMDAACERYYTKYMPDERAHLDAQPTT